MLHDRGGRSTFECYVCEKRTTPTDRIQPSPPPCSKGQCCSLLASTPRLVRTETGKRPRPLLYCLRPTAWWPRRKGDWGSSDSTALLSKSFLSSSSSSASYSLTHSTSTTTTTTDYWRKTNLGRMNTVAHYYYTAVSIPLLGRQRPPIDRRYCMPTNRPAGEGLVRPRHDGRWRQEAEEVGGCYVRGGGGGVRGAHKQQ